MKRRLHFLFRNSRGEPVYPDSPAGGTGVGRARPPRPTSLGNDHFGWDFLPHPDSPAGRYVTYADIAHSDTLERAQCVREAVERAKAIVGGYILQETGQGLKELISGIVPTLLLGAGILGLTTGVGAAGGAVLGSLGAGVGAVPGAMFGASVGFEAGAAILDALGLRLHFGQVATSLLAGPKRRQAGVGCPRFLVRRLCYRCCCSRYSSSPRGSVFFDHASNRGIPDR